MRFSFLHFVVRVRGMVRGVRMGHGMGNAASETAPDCRRRQDPSEFATVRQIAWCTVPRIDLNLQLSGNTCERMHDAMHEQARETCARCRINHASRHTREPASTEHSKKQHDTVRKMRKNTRATVCDTRKKQRETMRKMRSEHASQNSNSGESLAKHAQNMSGKSATTREPHSQNSAKKCERCTEHASHCCVTRATCANQCDTVAKPAKR